MIVSYCDLKREFRDWQIISHADDFKRFCQKEHKRKIKRYKTKKHNRGKRYG